MRKLKRIQLSLDKEVISSLSGNDLSFIRGGGGVTATCQVMPELTRNGNECHSVKVWCESGSGPGIAVASCIPIETRNNCLTGNMNTCPCQISNDCYISNMCKVTQICIKE